MRGEDPHMELNIPEWVFSVLERECKPDKHIACASFYTMKRLFFTKKEQKLWKGVGT